MQKPIPMKERLQLVKLVQEAIVTRQDTLRHKMCRYQPVSFTLVPEDLLPTEEIIAKFLQPITGSGSYMVSSREACNAIGKKHLNDMYEENKSAEQRFNKERHDKVVEIEKEGFELIGAIMTLDKSKSLFEEQIKKFAQLDTAAESV